MSHLVSFAATVHVIEIRDIPGVDASGLSDPFCRVTIGGTSLSRDTRIIHGCTSAVYDDEFIFPDVSLPAAEYAKATIRIQVFDANIIYRNELLGQFAFQISKVREQQTHQFYRQWVVLAHPDAPSSPRGFLKCTVTVLGKGDVPPSHHATIVAEPTLEVLKAASKFGAESKALISAPTTRRRGYDFEIKAIRAEHLVKECDSFLVVRFNGVVSRTPTKQRSRAPDWSYQMCMAVYTPIYSDAVELELWEEQGPALPDVMLASCTLSFSNILGEIYNPTWFNFYGVSPQENGFSTWWSSMIRAGKLEPTTFVGRTLVALSATLAEHPKRDDRPCPPLATSETETYLLYADVFQVMEVPVPLGGKVMAELRFGPPENTRETQWITPTYVTNNISTGDQRSFVDFSGKNGWPSQPISVILPKTNPEEDERQTAQLYDVVVSVYTKNVLGFVERVGFVRIKAIDVWSFENEPETHALKGYVANSTGFSQSSGFVTVALNFDSLTTKTTWPTKHNNHPFPLRDSNRFTNVHDEKFQIRAYVYQARDVPSMEEDGVVNKCHVTVGLGLYTKSTDGDDNKSAARQVVIGPTARLLHTQPARLNQFPDKTFKSINRTTYANNTLSPTWFETLMVDNVSIPCRDGGKANNPSPRLAPDIEITLYANDQIVGVARVPMELARPKYTPKKSRPRWIRLAKHDLTTLRVDRIAEETRSPLDKNTAGFGKNELPMGDYYAGEVLIKLQALPLERACRRPWFSRHKWPAIRQARVQFGTIGLRGLPPAVEGPDLFVELSIPSIPDVKQLIDEAWGKTKNVMRSSSSSNIKTGGPVAGAAASAAPGNTTMYHHHRGGSDDLERSLDSLEEGGGGYMMRHHNEYDLDSWGGNEDAEDNDEDEDEDEGDQQDQDVNPSSHPPVTPRNLMTEDEETGRQPMTPLLSSSSNQQQELQQTAKNIEAAIERIHRLDGEIISTLSNASNASHKINLGELKDDGVVKWIIPNKKTNKIGLTQTKQLPDNTENDEENGIRSLKERNTTELPFEDTLTFIRLVSMPVNFPVDAFFCPSVTIRVLKGNACIAATQVPLRALSWELYPKDPPGGKLVDDVFAIPKLTLTRGGRDMLGAVARRDSFNTVSTQSQVGDDDEEKSTFSSKPSFVEIADSNDSDDDDDGDVDGNGTKPQILIGEGHGFDLPGHITFDDFETLNVHFEPEWTSIGASSTQIAPVPPTPTAVSAPAPAPSSPTTGTNNKATKIPPSVPRQEIEDELANIHWPVDASDFMGDDMVRDILETSSFMQPPLYHTYALKSGSLVTGRAAKVMGYFKTGLVVFDHANATLFGTEDNVTESITTAEILPSQHIHPSLRPLYKSLVVLPEDAPNHKLPPIEPLVLTNPDVVKSNKIVLKKGDEEVEPIAMMATEYKPIKVRVYVLQATDLWANNPQSAKPFLKARMLVPPRVGDRFRGKTSVDDSHNVKLGNSPYFGSWFELDARFPDVSFLEISVWNKDGNGVMGDTFVGLTTIDLEDRWYNPTWQGTKAKRRFIKEFRTLTDPTMQTMPGGAPARGKVELWVEMYTPREVVDAKIADIRMPRTEEWELRLVVWETRGVPPPLNYNYISMYVTGEMAYKKLDGTWSPEQSLYTDTHYYVKTGMGLFNWRMKFGFEVPCKFPRLNLKVWSTEWLSIAPNEAVGMAVIDLEFLANLALARKDDLPIERPRTLVKLTSDGGVPRGELDIQISLVRRGVAVRDMVGLGREQPNKDPFLPEPKRESFGWGNIFKSFSLYRCFCCLILLAIPAVALAAVFAK